MEGESPICSFPDYGRGQGFPRLPGDTWSDSGMIQRCQKVHGYGNCEKYTNGLSEAYYPKCKPNYYSYLCCICRRNLPSCTGLPLGALGGYCQERTLRGELQHGICKESEELVAGRCYEKCPTGFVGIGAVSWGESPANWVDCGMTSANATSTCASANKGDMLFVGQLALNIITLHAASSIATLQAPVDATKLAELKTAWAAIKAKPIVLKAIEAFKAVNRRSVGYYGIEKLERVQTVDDYVRCATTIGSILHPALSNISTAFSFPNCDKTA